MKVAIAHPDLAVCHRLNRVLKDSFGLACIWEADGGRRLRYLFQRETPDILLLSLELEDEPVADLIPDLVKDKPCAILLLERSGYSEVAAVFDCLGQGAADVACLPENPLDADSAAWEHFQQRFATLRTLSGHQQPEESTVAVADVALSPPRVSPPIVALGASTGGPKALSMVLNTFPVNFPAAVIIVQHLDAHFYQGFAEWLGSGCRLPVVAVDAPMTLEAGRVYLAGRPEHLVLLPGHQLGYTRESPELVCRPSIDVLFHSIAQRATARGVAALMTGMGRDGAEGLLALRQRGFCTMAQDAASSVVFGMPRVAIEMGAASRVLPIDQMGTCIVDEVHALMDSEAERGSRR